MGQGTPKASVTSNNIFIFLIRKLKFSERVVQFSKIAQHIGAREKEFNAHCPDSKYHSFFIISRAPLGRRTSKPMSHRRLAL